MPTCLRPVKLSAPTAKLRYKIQAICAHDLQNLLRKKINKTNPRLTLGFVLFLFGAGGGGLNLDKLTLVRRIARRHAPPFSLCENPQYYLPHFSAFGAFPCGKAAFCRRRRQKKQPAKAGCFFGAGGGGRTRTVSLPLDFESSTSANSITPAYNGDSITHIGEKIKGFWGFFCGLFL